VRYGNYNHMDNGWGVVMVLGMVGIWVLVAAVIFLLIRESRGSVRSPESPSAGRPTSSAEQILAERLARGDIDAEEYRQRL
jgi:putative membrane protein